MIRRDKNFMAQICLEISDLKERQLSTRVMSLLTMIERELDKQVSFSTYEGKVCIPVLKGNDFGMIFQSIVYLPEDSKWVVISRRGESFVYFDALVDVLWYMRSIHLPLRDAIYKNPF